MNGEHHMGVNEEFGMKRICPAFAYNNVPVCFFSDDYYVPYLGTAVYSAIKNCAKDTNLDILIFENGYSQKNKKLLEELGEGKKNISIRFISLLPFLKNLKVTPHKRVSINCFAKIFCTDEIFSNYERVIAMDSDLLILQDLMPLYQSDMKGMLISAAKDLFLDIMVEKGYHTDKRLNYILLKEYIDNIELDANNYFNSGVVVYDIKGCQAENVQDKILNINNKYPVMMYAAQDDLNILFKNKWAELDAKWNVQNPYSLISHIGSFPQGYTSLMDHAGVLHFLGKSKPWIDRKVWKSELFDEYAKQTPWWNEYLVRRRTFEKKNRITTVLVPKGSKRRELWLKIFFGLKRRKSIQDEYKKTSEKEWT